jgi:hypothetical protein
LGHIHAEMLTLKTETSRGITLVGTEADVLEQERQLQEKDRKGLHFSAVRHVIVARFEEDCEGRQWWQPLPLLSRASDSSRLASPSSSSSSSSSWSSPAAVKS